ncbi:hypothetical protein RI129_010792 [Pyrocoelia pectoralis]|uniref:Uncharacterized protein n=1 Tax=Pyrocoelia pectoralis TaxID=417401 RepID=A0AAN7ZGS8_9COLE
MKGKNSSTCYLWDETIANRGGQEIGSCLYLHLKNLPAEITEINMYSDCCPGQNKNILIAVMLLTILHEFSLTGRQITINHKFLVPGHTHMEADTIHAAIEKTKKCTTANIHVPRDWANLIRPVPKNPPIKVVEVQQCQFLNFKQLLGGIFQHRKTTTMGSAVIWSQIRWIQYRTTDLGTVFYKNSVCPNEEFNILDLTRKRLRNVPMTQLVPISDTPLLLPSLKIQNLKELIPYIDANSRPYYETFLKTLSPSQTADEYYPDEEPPSNDDEDLV